MSLPADFPSRPAPARRPVPVPPPGGPELRGVLHDVGHGLFTLSLLLDQIAEDVRRSRRADVFDLLEEEVSQLLAVVHSETRRGAKHAPVELRTLLRPFAVAAGRTTLTKVVVRPGPPVVVPTDPAKLWRIVSNLLDNAVRAAGPLGTVEIAVEDAGEWFVTIDVSDDGPGFQQGPAGVAQLGLSVVNRLLAECGGRLRIDDVRPHGTRMRVLLPTGGPAGPRTGPLPGAQAGPVGVERTGALRPSRSAS